MNEPIGIIAGESILPVLCAQAARRRGLRPVAAGIRRVTAPELAANCDAYEEFSLGQIGKAIRYFQRQGVTRAVMVGRVPHPAIYELFRLDRKLLVLLSRIRSMTTTSLLGAVADLFTREGVAIVDSAGLLEEMLAGEGILAPGGRPPDEALRRDIDFGWEKAWGLAGLDIGQTVCVKDRAVVAVEAMEGTDETIRRAGGLAGPGLVVVKVSRPGKEMRFDLPVIGPETMAALEAVRARALVVEAGRTLLIDEPELLRRARSARICLMGKK